MKQRNASFEVLRLIAMVMVITMHALGHGGLLEQYDMGQTGYYIGWLIQSLSYVAVNCFVLLTGYFMVTSEMKLSRILKLIAQVWFYSALCLLAAKLLFHKPIGLRTLVYALFPLTAEQYWFATAYVLLLIVTPLLNQLIRSMDRKGLLKAIALLTVLFSVVPTVFFWSRPSVGYGFEYTWFIVLYFASAYIRLYGVPFSKKMCLGLYFALSLLAFASHIVIMVVTKALIGRPVLTKLLFQYNSVLFFAAAVSLFAVFEKTEMKGKVAKVFASFGKMVFGAYLISDHVLIRQPLWALINIPSVADKGLLTAFGYMAVAVVAIIAVGCAVEWLRSWIVEKIGFNKLFAKADRLLEKAVNWAQERVD